MSDRQRLAWSLIRRRLWMVRLILQENRRDAAGQLLASSIAIGRMLPVALWNGGFSSATSIELRAVRNSRRSLLARVSSQS